VDPHVQGTGNKSAPYRARGPGKPLFWPRDRSRARSLRDRSRGNTGRESLHTHVSIHPIVHSAPPLSPIRRSVIHPILNHPTPRHPTPPHPCRFCPDPLAADPPITPRQFCPNIGPDNLRALKKCSQNLASLKMYQHSLAPYTKVPIVSTRRRGKHPSSTAAPPKLPKPQSPKAPKPQSSSDP
jgi:hypothetical protein